MKKVIYQNNAGKLVAETNGGVMDLKQYYDGCFMGQVSLSYEEMDDLKIFVDQAKKRESTMD